MSKLLETILLLCIINNLHGLDVAVVEFEPDQSISITEEQRFKATLDSYLDLIRETTTNNIQQVDLIVFPESTLNIDNITKLNVYDTTVEIHNIGDLPYTDLVYAPYIKELSLEAYYDHVHLVINTIERERCSIPTKVKRTPNRRDNCKEFCYRFYNTDVVFNPEGRIIAKYRKRHLFGEFDLDIPEEESVSFNINNKTIGLLTCFDILFKNPAEKLIRVQNVTHFAFPAMWFGELPFLTALQVQQMWAHEHNVTLYASGASNPSVGSGGSGIYLGNKGPVRMALTPDDGAALTLISNDDEIEEEPSIVDDSRKLDSFNLITDPSLVNYTSKPLVKLEDSFELKNGNLVCKFEYSMSLSLSDDKQAYTYQAVAYAGVRSLSGMFNGGVEICGVIACLNSSVLSCGNRFSNFDDIEWKTTFNRIRIEGDYNNSAGNRVQYPNSLLSNLKPIEPKDTNWSRNVVLGKERRVFELKSPESYLLTFAIFGRNYELDSEVDTSGTTISRLNILALLLVILVKILY